MVNNQLPLAFLEATNRMPGINTLQFMDAHMSADLLTSIRINPYKKYTPDGQFIPVPWCNQGYYLESRPSFTFDPLFHAGCYYVQEASSMFVSHVYHTISGHLGDDAAVLDLCAAPGGKSTLLASVLKPDDLLVANEIIKTRVPLLTDNLTRWGISNSVVTNNDPKDFGRLPGFFDVMLVDAPCSGSGMFRKDPDAILEWSEANVNLCHQRQERILADAYPALKQDGYLIYSTCSYSIEENEHILDWLCSEFEFETVRIPIEARWGIVETNSTKLGAWGYRFYPGQVQGEGLFIACLRKTEAAGETKLQRIKSALKTIVKEIDSLKAVVNDVDRFHYFDVNGDWLALPKSHQYKLQILQQNLYIKKSGFRLGRFAGREIVPDHELALSNELNRDAFITTELSYEQAINYLRRDNVHLETDGKGWSLMTYQHHALGWAKLLPNRINNYYPKELRILAASRPEL